MSKAIRLAATDLDTVEAVLEDGTLSKTVERLNCGGGLTSGVWESEAHTWETEGYPVDETCVIIEGTVVFRYPDGMEESYGPGEAFAIKKGTPLTWHQDVLVRKYYVIRES